MRVCIDTNVLVQLFGTTRPYRPIVDALQQGRLELAVSTEILLEYEETVTQLSGQARWQMVMNFFNAVSRLHNNVLYVEPHFRFRVITTDPDDNNSSIAPSPSKPILYSPRTAILTFCFQAPTNPSQLSPNNS